MSNNIINNYVAFPTKSTDVTASRVAGTSYQNLTNRPIYVSVVAVCPSGTSVSGYADTVTAPNPLVSQVLNNNVLTVVATLFFIVLPGYYYRVVFAGASGITVWVEWN